MRRARPPSARAALAAAAPLFALLFWLWPRGEGARPPASKGPGVAPADAPAAHATAPPRTAADAPPAALPGEEAVAVASGVVVEAIEQSRPWACAGGPLRLLAHSGGEGEPGAVARWLWRGDSGVEIEPGEALSWRAPSAPGRYLLRFQVCKDLGGRRVAVLADRAHEVEVRACGAADGAEGPLRLRVARPGGSLFRFDASYEGGDPPVDYVWHFDDGPSIVTAAPVVEHAFDAAGLGPNETRAFAARVVARLASGGAAEAVAFAVVRGRPPPRDAPDVELEVGRPVASPGGGFQSKITLRVPPPAGVTWARLERVVRGEGGEARSATLPFEEAVRVGERLERGGFRGEVLVGGADAGPGVKQVLDTLYGRDASGREIVASWSPFKREAPRAP